MQKLVIEGEKRLGGEVFVHGAKNAALPLLAASVLCSTEVTFTNCPALSDVYASCRILTGLGILCRRKNDELEIFSQGIKGFEVPEELMREMRSSIVFLGAILGRMGRCRLSFPGGCELGPRPIDMHIASLRQMGAVINEEYGVLDCTAPKGIKGASILLPFPSVGATENVIMAAVLAKGRTLIKNAAREPEIVDLAEFLNRCGAKVYGAGTSDIVIDGVKSLHGCEYKVMPDRIAAATYLAAAAITGGEATLLGVQKNDMTAVLDAFAQMGCRTYDFDDRIYLSARKPLKAVNIRTAPYPGFPTDAQSVFLSCLAKANGTSVIVESIFENRYRQVDELNRMGCKIKTEGRVAVVEGVRKLYGANVMATDLRGGAALVLAGLAAQGVTTVGNIKLIDRGYESIERDLARLGADIKRVDTDTKGT